ncbi:MAG: hypothetical protein NC179_05630, partial [[Eubacterium] siraeum]|nr:hypothetical protein [[Eubacterium] siraeum]
MKRKVFSAACLIIALVLLVCLVACGEKPEKYNVTAEYNSEQGTVVIADAEGNVKTTFESGKKAVVTVTANGGYAVDSFKVNDEAAQLSGGSYSFGVTKNTVVKV